MRTDSAGWAVGFAGCFVDWLITRNWRRISLGLLPILAASAVGGLVAWGSMLDRDQLAERYLKLADAEVAEWENTWAPAQDPVAEKTAAPTVDQTAPQDGATSPAASAGPAADKKAIPHFAEVLFRRVQQFHAGDQRSVFFVAMTLAQRGSVPQALSLLSRIAPDDREGYGPAHVWLTQYYLSQPITAENLKTVKHHARAALGWPRTPPALLAAISQLFWRAGEPDTAVRSLTKAAERDPKFNLQLAGLASGGEKWKLLREQSLSKAESHLGELVASKPQDVETRLQLVSAQLLKKDFANAERIVLEGRTLDDDPRLRHAQSEIYRLQFAATMSFTNSTWTGNVELLNKAFQADPTNVRVFEEVAQLARLTGEAPNPQLNAELHRLLAEGKATAITHLWIAERYLVTNDLKKAVPHLEQALQRSPDAVYCLNNLAYCLATLYPDRREEALAYIDRAIAIYGKHPAYHDTRGTILLAMDRPKEAIASFERAVELLHETGQPPKASYHQRLAAAYELIGQSEVAQEHERIATRLLEEQSRPPAKNAAPPVTSPATSPANDLGDAPKPAELAEPAESPANAGSAESAANADDVSTSPQQ